MSNTTAPELTFGSLALHPGGGSTYSGFYIETTAEGTQFGNPEALVVAVNSLLQDGGLASITRYDNRTEFPVRVRIVAENSDGLAEGESALFAEVREGTNTLVWKPPQPDAVESVFQVVVSTLDRDYDDDSWDIDETRLTRAYQLTFTCLPFTRSVDLTTVAGTENPVPPSSPTITSIDVCTSTTNWIAGSGTFETLVTGTLGSDTYLEHVILQAPTDRRPTLTRSATISMGSLTYLRIKVYGTMTGTVTKPVKAWSYRVYDPTSAAGDMPIVARSENTDGTTYLYVKPTVTSIPKLAVQVTPSTPAAPASGSVRVFDISTTNGLPIQGTARQRSFTLNVAGSARTQASLEIFDPGPAALGADTLVYTRPSEGGLLPPLRTWFTSGGTFTADTSKVSGAFSLLGPSPTVFEIPADRFAEGTYALMARMARATADTTAQTMTWSVSLRDPLNPSLTNYGPTVTGSIPVTLSSTADSYAVFDLARLTLPPVRVVSGSRYVVRIELATLNTAATVRLDEAWLFDISRGQLSWVNTANDSETVAALQINTATLDYPRPEYRIAPATTSWVLGRNADNRVQAYGVHEFEPGSVDVFLVTTSSLAAQVALAYYMRWHSHARR